MSTFVDSASITNADTYRCSNSNQQSRELIELLARAEVDESGAFSFPSFDTLKNIGSIGGSAFSILHNIFGG